MSFNPQEKRTVFNMLALNNFTLIAIAILLLLVLLTSCTDNEKARNFGGTEKIQLPKGQRLVTATWKKDDLWYLTEPMPENYLPQTREFIEKSSFGVWEGKVIFLESK